MPESNESALQIVRFVAVCDIDNDDDIDPSERPSKRSSFGWRWKATPGHAVVPPAQRRRTARRNRRKGLIDVRYSEFVDLSDGTTLPIRNDRGSGNYRRTDSGESILAYARDYLDQLEKGCCPTSPQWVIERLRRIHGVEIDSSSVHAALQKPRRIELGSRLVQHLE